MANIVWGNINDIHQGIDRVALRVFNDSTKKYGGAVAFNGVTTINESPSGAEATKLYADNKNFGSLTSKEEFALTLECYCTPTAFDACDGSAAVGTKGFNVGMQQRQKFALIYREFVDEGNRANDAKGIYHVVIGCKAAPSAKDHASINDSPEAATLSYEISTTPEKVSFATGASPVSEDEVVHFTIENDDATAANLMSALYDDTDTWDEINSVLDLTDIYSAAT